MTESSRKPVFFDSTGKRWKHVKIIFLVFIIIILGLLVFSLPKTLEQININPYELYNYGNRPELIDNRSPSEIAYELNSNQTPIIGSGPLLRVLKITHDWQTPAGVDPFSGDAVKRLSKQDIKTVGNSEFAIERYGQTAGKKIILTFDDGPDAVYTPEILNVLSEEKIRASFFALGEEVAQNPEIAKRAVNEGHTLANHTFVHSDLDLISGFRAKQEILQTQRIIRATTSKNPSYFRIPYGGNDDQSVRDDMRAILEAQSLGFVVVSYDFDPKDWRFENGSEPKLPEFDNSSKVILLHDGGGDREQTVSYLKRLIQEARKNGYTFDNLDGIYDDKQHLNEDISPSLGDYVTLTVANLVLVWPKQLITGLFILSLALLFYSMLLNVILAGLELLKPRQLDERSYDGLLSVIIPAYNEGKVLHKSVLSILKSKYSNFEIIIVNDGSKDNTQAVMEVLANDNRVIGITQENSGKAGAINRGLQEARGEVVISIDADTVFPPWTLGNFARHFADPEVGAVAGTVKVGNMVNFVTRWQALEYITSTNIERTAQSYLGAIMIVPGACSAWRKEAIINSNGYSDNTLAEDCDLTLTLHQLGYKVKQDIDAEAYTEAPTTVKDLSKQRFRWIYGNIQAFWKHREIMFNRSYSWLGLFVMPRAILSIIMQMLFAPFLIFVSFGNIISGNIKIVVIYFIISLVILFIAALIGIVFAGEKYKHLLSTPMYRIMYGPMRTFLLYASVIAAIRGLRVGWNKIARSGT